MSGRIALGQKSGQYGLWVSRPGVEVLTASDDDMLLSTSRTGLMIIASGVIYSPGNNTTHDFTIPALGYTPLVIVTGAYVGGWSFPSSTTLRIHVFTGAPYAGAQNIVGWALTNQRIHH